MSICGDLTLVKREGYTQEAVTLPCHSWTCDHCQPNRRARLIANAIHGQPNTFLTLTSRRVPDKTPEEAAADLSRAWRLIRKRAHREAKRDIFKNRTPAGPQPADAWGQVDTLPVPRKVVLDGDGIEFIAVFEATKFGWPHLHILCRSKWIDQQWLSLQAGDILASPIVDVRRVQKQHQVAGYVAKYVGKAPHRFGTTKRYWSSRQFAPGFLFHEDGDAPAEEGWRVVSDPLVNLAELWTDLGWRVEWTGVNRLKATIDPPTGPPRRRRRDVGR